jgi:hypothetical protein
MPLVTGATRRAGFNHRQIKKVEKKLVKGNSFK